MGRESVSFPAGVPEPDAALRLLGEPVVPDGPLGCAVFSAESGEELAGGRAWVEPEPGVTPLPG